MAAIHNLRRRLKSVKNTRQITRAMKLVSAARMKKAQDQIFQARPYAYKLRDVIRSIGAKDVVRHPLMVAREEQTVKVVVVSADRGLCGSFNAVINRRVVQLADEMQQKEIRYDFVGRKAHDFFRNKLDTIDRARTDVFQKFDPSISTELAAELVDDYTSERVDAIYVVYNEFKSVIQQNLVVERLLPLVPEEFGGDEPEVPHKFEPDAETVLADMLPLYVENQLYRILLESNAAEFAARMTAMESATNNASDMIDQLTLEMNKIRQAGITNEIIEVVSGGQLND